MATKTITYKSCESGTSVNQKPVQLNPFLLTVRLQSSFNKKIGLTTVWADFLQDCYYFSGF